MTSWIAGLIVTDELVCDGCGKVMRHPERYGYICEDCFEELVNSDLSIEEFLCTNTLDDGNLNDVRRERLEKEFKKD